MKKKLLALLLLAFINGCKTDTSALNNYESKLLRIERVTDNIFKHTSFLKTKNSGLIPSNGMIYVNNNEAVIFDTPVDIEASKELIKWLGKTEIKAVVVTHFHVDCLGGLDEFHLNGIESYATTKTIALAKENKSTLPKNGFLSTLELNIGHEVINAKYLGEGHTIDNIVGYVPSEKALFGGCLVKELSASKGNLTDANVADWPRTIEKIKSDIPEIEIVIPGHGKHGGIELLDYTLQLFKTTN